MRITIIVVVVLWLIPTVGVLVTSFRPERLVDTTGWWTALGHPFRAGEWTLDNYRSVLDAGGFENAFLNSLAVDDPGDRHPDHDRRVRRLRVLVDGVPRPVRAVRARRRAAGRAAADGADPDPAALHAAARSSAACTSSPTSNLNGTFLGVWLAHTAFGLPLAVYLLRNYIGVAAVVDHRVGARSTAPTTSRSSGGSIVPLSVPALAAFAIFQFLWVWNDLLVAYVFLGGTPDTRVVTIALANLVGARGENWHLLTSAAFISMVLPLVVFFSLQRYFVRGLTAGSVKG